MAREGTRSATGNSKPRVFQTVDTSPAIERKPRTKTTTTKKAGAKPVGVTKKAGRPKKENTIAKKARTAKTAVKKVEAKVKKATAKPKTAKPKTAAK